ncbi:MAG: DnaJ domain-containing protein [Bernardetiaceae bacterium]|nr:DnaJ domain-containing protein [Bernardetiaceae bacterium]
MENYYHILGIPEFASISEVKVSFKRLAVRYHPDLHPNDSMAEENFKRINEAYQTLSSQDKKAQYDEILKYLQMQEREIYTAATRRSYYYRRKSHQERSAREAAEDKKLNRHAIVFTFTFLIYVFLVVKSMFAFFADRNYQNALILYQKGESEEALKLLNQGLAFDKTHDGAYYLRAYIYREQAQFIETAALENFSKAILYAKVYRKQYYFQRGLTATTLGDIALAHSDFDIYRNFSSATDDEIELMAESYIKLGSYERAQNSYDELLQKYPNNKDFWYGRARVCLLAQEYTKAHQAIEQFLLHSPSKEDALNQIIDYIKYTLEKPELLPMYYQKRIDNAPQNIAYRTAYIDFYIEKEQYQKAMTLLNQSIEQKAHADFYARRAKIYIDNSDLDKACQDWREAQHLGYKGSDARLDFFCKDDDK